MSERKTPPRTRRVPAGTSLVVTGAPKAAASTNVVALPKRFTGDEAIVASVLDRSQQQSDDLLQKMRELNAELRDRHRERANALLPIALRMDRPTLDNFIEIGQRMLAARARS